MNNNNLNIVPVVCYSNAHTFKVEILESNRRKSGIYRWNNLVTGKSYVGSSVNLTDRFSIYYSQKAMLSKLSTRTSIIYSAILKHGYANFSLDILEYCEINILIKREQYYLDSLKPEYNILKTANSRLGSKHSEATKIKMSISQIKVKHHLFGKRLSQEVRMKISESVKAYRLRVKVKPKIRTPETKLKLSLTSHGINVKIFDKSNNLVNKFPSMNSAAKYFGVSGSTIRRIGNRGIYDNFIFEFEAKDFRVWMCDSNKNLIKIFNNNKETSKFCNIPHTTLNTYITSGKLYDSKFYFYNIKSKSNPFNNN